MSITHLFVLISSLAPPQEPAATKALEVFQLQPFVAAEEPYSPPPYGTLLTVQREPVDLLGQREGGQFAGDHAHELLQMLQPAACEQERLLKNVQGSRLFVAAEQELLAEVRTELHAVMALLGRPIEIEAAVYALDDAEPPPAVVSGDAAKALLAGRTPLWRASARTRSNVRASFQQLRWSRYVREANVEVAQDSHIASPVIDAFAEGIAAAVEPHALAGSEDIVLYAQFALGQRRQVDHVLAGKEGHPGLDLPCLESAHGGVAARVPPGGALLVTLGGEAAAGARLLLALRPRYPEPRPSERIGRLVVLPVSALTSRALLGRPYPPVALPLLNEEGPDVAYEHDDDAQRFDPGYLLELLTASFEQPDGEVTLRYGGGWVFVGSDPGIADRALATLQALQERLLRTVELRARIDLGAAAASGPFAAADAGGQPRHRHELVLPGLLGHRTILCRGLEHAVLRTQMPEIAQGATEMRPIVETLRSSLWASFCPTPAPAGLAPELKLQYDEQSPPANRNLASGGMLMLTDSATARFRRDEPCDDRETALGEGPVVELAGAPFRSSAVARIRKL